MSMECEDCGEEPAEPRQEGLWVLQRLCRLPRLCGSSESAGAALRPRPRARSGGLASRHLPLEPPVEERLVLPPLVGWRPRVASGSRGRRSPRTGPEASARLLPSQRDLSQVVVQRHVEAVAVARRALQTSQGQPFGVAVGAPWADLLAARHRIPRLLDPLDIAHRLDSAVPLTFVLKPIAEG